MQSQPTRSDPDGMNYKEFVRKIEYFFPELYKLANDILISKVSVEIILLDNYAIEGFHPNNTSITETIDEDRNYMLYTIIFEKSKYDTKNAPNHIRLLAYTKFVKFFYGYITDNKDKHLYWFL